MKKKYLNFKLKKMNQKNINNKALKNPRPPSVNSKKGKKPKTDIQYSTETLPKAKSLSKRSTTPLKAEKDSIKDYSKISKKEKSVKINASVNTLNDKEDVSLIDFIQDKGNSIIEAKNDKNFNNSFKKKENLEAKVNLSYYTSEIKITPNIATINKLINKSQDVVSEQKNILDNITELNKRLVSSEFDLQRQLNKAENDDFNNISDQYLSNLHDVIEKLKTHSEEMENLKGER